MTRWGVVATVKAPLDDILSFAAHHADLGAHRIYIYLDAPDPAAETALGAHPKCRVTVCDAGHWARLGGRRPVKHQVRQTRNATHALARGPQVDWLAHIDVDEFLTGDLPVAQALAALPPDCLTARVRPMELLAGGDGTAFKACQPPGPGRAATARALYPRFGTWLADGFLSHVAGKLFVRTTLAGAEFRIHNLFRGQTMNPGEAPLDRLALAHRHTTSWDHWIAAYRYRLDHGAYRSELAPAHAGLNLHALLSGLEEAEGIAGLRAFFDEVCADTPALRAGLAARGLLRLCDLDLAARRARQFPQAPKPGAQP